MKEGNLFKVTSLGWVYKIWWQNPQEEKIKHLNTLIVVYALSFFFFLAADLPQLKQLYQT